MLIYVAGQLSQKVNCLRQRFFALKFKMESSTDPAQSECDTLCTIISLVRIIKSLLCSVISRLTRRGRREILMMAYDCGSHGQYCEHCIECIAMQH